MMRFAREHPEDFEERIEAMRDAADIRREEPDVFACNPDEAAYADLAEEDDDAPS